MDAPKTKPFNPNEGIREKTADCNGYTCMLIAAPELLFCTQFDQDLVNSVFKKMAQMSLR
jgi:hypothetical protein